MGMHESKKNAKDFDVLVQMPKWGKIQDDESGLLELQHLRAEAMKLSALQVGELRMLFTKYFEIPPTGSVEISHRLDDARIVCFFAFELPWDHPFSVYFDEDACTELELKLPGILDNVNRGRFESSTAVTLFFTEFDRIEKNYPRREIAK